jgi:predicted nuclease of predicted toxin-antitoxin system
LKLLFDENLSPRLVSLLADLFPHSAHAHDLSLGHTDDTIIWKFAKEHSYTLVSKDSDHYELSMLHGHPPKVIWIRMGNCSTKSIEEQIRLHHFALSAFISDPDQSAFLLP